MFNYCYIKGCKKTIVVIPLNVHVCYNTECNQYFNVTTWDVITVITQNYNDSEILFQDVITWNVLIFNFCYTK